jgi:SprT protein
MTGRFHHKALVQFLEKIPAPAQSYVLELIENSTFRIIMTNQRISRHGSFAVSRITRQPSVRISFQLSPHLFLLVFLHEAAHYKVWLHKGNRHVPHGKEWKNEFSLLLKPLLEIEELDNEFREAVYKVMQKTKATFNNDLLLLSIINRLDDGNKFKTVREFAEGESFILSGKRFIKMKTLRTRTKCFCPDDKKYYLVSLNAQIFQ